MRWCHLGLRTIGRLIRVGIYSTKPRVRKCTCRDPMDIIVTESQKWSIMSISWPAPHSDLLAKLLGAVICLTCSSLYLCNEFYPREKRAKNPPRFLNSLTFKCKIKSHQILKLNYKYDDNYTFNLYSTLNLFKALFCPFSLGIIGVVFISRWENGMSAQSLVMTNLQFLISSIWNHKWEEVQSPLSLQKSVSSSISQRLSLQSLL